MDRAGRLELLLDIVRALADTPSLDVLLNAVVDRAIEFIGADRGFILIVGEHGGVDFLVAREMQRGDILDERARISLSVVHEVLRSGKPLFFHESELDAELEKRESAMQLELRSVLCVPLRPPARAPGMSDPAAPLGVIYVDSRSEARPFSRAELELFLALAEQVSVILGHMLLEDRLRSENAELRRQIEKRYAFAAIIGSSAAIQRTIRLAEKVAPSDASVVICGESGTGKELLARAIHHASKRAAAPFLGINCASLAESILEAELFGIEAGVATGVRARQGLFEQAGGGTLFLDEVADMPLAMQGKILRVLQNRALRRVGGRREIPVDVRILCATNRDLWAEVQAGRFRKDLYYRLDVVTIDIPPLRERVEDIPLLAKHFLQRAAQTAGKQLVGFTPEALQVLCSYSWPGNVRELENQIERAVILCEHPSYVGVEDLSPRVRGLALAEATGGEADAPPGRIRDAVAELERRMIRGALERTGGNKTEAARLLGISRESLRQKLRLYGLS
jgi:Nif-specific regulatory protein